MKTYGLCLSLALALLSPALYAAVDASAGTPDTVSGPSATLVVDTNTPAVVSRIADGLHVLDNGTASTFYDANNGVWLAGAITTPYKKYYVSVDLGTGAPMVANASLEFIGGLRLNVGELALDKIPALAEYIPPTSPLRNGLLKYTAAGVFYSRDWTAGLNRFGPYAGIEYHFH
jgi:hypothetical protein